MVTDKGTGAENLIWLASRQSGRADRSLLAADDILAALTGRIAELEARVSEILAEVDPALPPVDSKHGGALSAPKPDASRGTDKIRDASVEADAELTRASEERRMLANEMRLLREAFQEARRNQLPAGRGADTAEAQVVPDLRAVIAEEMRSLLTEVLADFRSRGVAPPPLIEGVPAKGETVPLAAATPAAIVEEVVEGLHTAAPVVNPVASTQPPIVEHVDELVRASSKPLVDQSVEDRQTTARTETLANVAAPIDTSESIVEHVDELVRPTTKPLVGNSVADVRESEPAARVDVSPVESAAVQPAGAIVEEFEESFRTKQASSIEIADLQVAPPAPAPPIADEHVFGPAEPVAPIIDEYVDELRRPEAPPPTGTVDVGPALAEPIIDEFIEELRRPEAPPMIETSELSAAPSEPIIDEYVDEPRWSDASPIETTELSAAPAEPIEPIAEEYVDDVSANELAQPIVDDYGVRARDVAITPQAPPSAPDPRIAALWEATPTRSEVETAPLSSLEPASFITDEFIAATRSLDIPEAPPEVPQEFSPEPPVEFAAPPPVEFAPEPPAIVEPEPEMRWEPPIAEPAPIFGTPFPELTVADEKGLHQIQVVISPIHSFPRLLETERRIRALTTVNALHLRDFRNGVATLTVAVSEAISPAEFGAVIQMLENLHLRLEGTTQSTVELHAEDEPPTE
jgi:hypothetical protein